MNTKKLLLMTAMSVCSMLLQAQSLTYYSENLAQASKALGLESNINSLPQGISHIQHKGRTMVVELSDNRQVTHIGIPLFSLEMRKSQPRPIYNFLEYALLNHTYKISENSLWEGDIKFVKGSWATLGTVGDTLGCNITNIDNRAYDVAWLKDGQPVCEVMFPISYSLLANSGRREIEQNFIRDLAAYQYKSDSTEQSLDTLKLRKITDTDLYYIGGNTFMIPEVTDNVYYRRYGDDIPIFSKVRNREFPAETFQNFVLGAGEDMPKTDIGIRFVKYDYKSDSLSLDMKAFMQFCKQSGCTPYFGIVSITEELAKGTLFLQNKDSGYEHVINITAPTSELLSKSVRLSAQAYLYAPLSNIKSLFGDYKRKKTDKIRIK